ncbi:acylneuraminate cytidylyltransferase family protein [Lysinibacillus fusiformis]|uniref:acylneuraminate cytidylyltransferase family protein n=1 Tax=Lysinibacillus fusiformis TaxID=28031 RepID=UPI001F4D63F3|nr:acylneuraminate cytidylyltransferase family protein [Lysinibacillus fusiformis]MCK1986500.1 acylneuraminate cytidylyltransferase family protein [Lysinibacillus fusiformis]
MKNCKVLAIIPARSGSKTVKDKNIRNLAGKPMIAYSIEHAKQSKYIDRIVVSTDSEKYAQIARIHGAETPFIRPNEISGDESLDIEVFYHALVTLKQLENYQPDIVVHLRPTYPIRNVDDIDQMIESLIKDTTLSAVRCIAPAKEIPYKMWTLNSEGLIEPIFTEIPEIYNMPRQKLPKVFYQNACIDVIRSTVILNEKSMTGNKIKGYIMEHNFDIDTEEEFIRAEKYLDYSKSKQRFVFDIDGVIAELNSNLSYQESQPNERLIKEVNKLYEEGHYIVLFTARGYVTKIDWREITEKQLENWGLRYHELHFGKPNADYYIDDKMLSIEDLMYFNLLKEKLQ